MKQITKKLAATLADIHQLYIKTLAYHWNVEDARFFQLHKLFQEQYEELAEHLDLVAERIRMLGEKSPGSIREFNELKRLNDTEVVSWADDMIEQLSNDYKALIEYLKEDIDQAADQRDPGTADLLTNLLRSYEKSYWILVSHLKKS
ncbi:MAG: DNA starvation/stationary phase protection protein [Waddliaceae bacterium]